MEEGTEAQAILRLPSVRGVVAQHSTHVTNELRKLTPPAVAEVPDMVHEVRVNVESSEYIAPPFCISEHGQVQAAKSATHRKPATRVLDLPP